MRTTISTLALLSLLLAGTLVSPAQTRGPSQMYDELDAAGQAEVDALYTDRAPMVLGWNWGAALLGVNDDLGSLPSGIYTVQVTTLTGTVLTRQVAVVK